MIQRLLSLLFILSFAPACAPNVEPSDGEPEKARPLVLLTDTLSWKPGDLVAYRDSLESENYRVLISGFSGESPTQLVVRLPWLLQPGVALFLYDESLAGPAGGDSLRAVLQRMELDISVENVKR